MSIQRNLLSIVQYILSSLDSDEVASIHDTVESKQIAVMAEQLFYDIAVDLGVEEHKTMLELNASLSSLTPCIMTVPTGTTSIEWIKYDNKTSLETIPLFTQVHFKEFNEFLEMMNGLRGDPDTATQPVSMNGEVFEFTYRTDKHPQYYTSLDGSLLIFDSLDTTVDTTLQKSKSMSYGTKYPVFSLSDTYVPDLDPAHFPYFLNKLKARAFGELKQAANQEASSEARRQKIISQPRRERVKSRSFFDRIPKYGRK